MNAALPEHGDMQCCATLLPESHGTDLWLNLRVGFTFLVSTAVPKHEMTSLGFPGPGCLLLG